jgi:Lrp/AsnC family transcriptional regulator for asnA, asnC and gidA
MSKRSRDELASIEEERIIELLQKDARMPLAKIAKLVGLSENTIRKRIDKLKRRGYIREFALLLNPKKFGKHVKAIFLISTELSKAKDCVKQLKKLHSIINIYFTTGEYSILAVGLFNDDEELNTFLINKLSKLDIHQYNVITVLDKIKEGYFEI